METAFLAAEFCHDYPTVPAWLRISDSGFSASLFSAGGQSHRPQKYIKKIRTYKTITKRCAKYLCGVRIAEYDSVTEAAEKNKVHPGSISHVLVGRYQTLHGYEWRYI